MKKTIVALLMGILVLSILMVLQPMIMGLFLDEAPTILTYMKAKLDGAWMVGVIVDDVATIIEIILIIISVGVPILIFILTSVTLIIVFRKIKTF